MLALIPFIRMAGLSLFIAASFFMETQILYAKIQHGRKNKKIHTRNKEKFHQNCINFDLNVTSLTRFWFGWSIFDFMLAKPLFSAEPAIHKNKK